MPNDNEVNERYRKSIEEAQRKRERTAHKRIVVEEPKTDDKELEDTQESVMDLLSQEGGAAKAVILSEVLNRKY